MIYSKSRATNHAIRSSYSQLRHLSRAKDANEQRDYITFGNTNRVKHSKKRILKNHAPISKFQMFLINVEICEGLKVLA